jgi:hypothetical protein
VAGEFRLAGLARRLAGLPTPSWPSIRQRRLAGNRPQDCAIGELSNIDQEDVQPVFKNYSI